MVGSSSKVGNDRIEVGVSMYGLGLQSYNAYEKEANQFELLTSYYEENPSNGGEYLNVEHQSARDILLC